MIAIINYGLGNIQAIANIYGRLGIRASIASTAGELAAADRFVLPGVGAFDWAMERLNASGMRNELERRILKERRPVLGICVGMQMLANASDEGQAEGLGWVDGVVRRFDDQTPAGPQCLPHMGWNDVDARREEGLFAGLGAAARFYFLHSYYFVPEDEADILATTDYGATFVSSVRHRNVMGVQFHPEKSHHWGIQLLKNFADGCQC